MWFFPITFPCLWRYTLNIFFCCPIAATVDYVYTSASRHSTYTYNSALDFRSSVRNSGGRLFMFVYYIRGTPAYFLSPFQGFIVWANPFGKCPSYIRGLHPCLISFTLTGFYCIGQSRRKMSRVYTFSWTSSKQLSYLLAMMAWDISLNFFRSLTTTLPKKVLPSSNVGS